MATNVLKHGQGVHGLHEINQRALFRMHVDSDAKVFLKVAGGPEMIGMMVCSEKVAELFSLDAFVLQGPGKGIKTILMRRAGVNQCPFAISKIDEIDIDDGWLSRKGKRDLDYAVCDRARRSRSR